PRRVVRHDEVAAVREEVDLRTRDARLVALAQAFERVRRVRAAPDRLVRLQLDDAAVAPDDRIGMRVGERALRDQAMRSPLARSKRWMRSAAKRSPTRSPICARKPGGAIARRR